MTDLQRAQSVLFGAIDPAVVLLRLAPRDSARVQLVAIGLQESRLTHRFQVVQGKPGVKGPARGLFQFEKGTQSSRGGLWGVYLFPSTRQRLQEFCELQNCAFHPDALHLAIEQNDVLAAGVARLLLLTDPKPLPPVGEEEAAWLLYLRTWRPGAAQRQYDELRQKWRYNYALAVAAVAPLA